MSEARETTVEIGRQAGEALAASGSGDETTSLSFESVLTLLFYLLLIPFYLLYVCVAWLLCFVNVSQTDSTNHTPPGKLFYQKMQKVQEAGRRVTKLPSILRSRLVMLLLIWLTVNLSLPGLRHKLVHGFKLWKWTLLLTMVLCGYQFVSMGTQLLLNLLYKNNSFRKTKSVVYFAKGMRHSVNLVVLFGSVLSTWLLYFRTSHGFKEVGRSSSVIRIGTWSLSTLTAGAVLWVVKSFFLLQWEAVAVYERFRARIVNAGFQCFFLGHICGWHSGLFKPKSKKSNKDGQVCIDKNRDRLPMQLEHGEMTFCSPGELAMAEITSERKQQKDIRAFKEKTIQILCVDKDSTLYDIKKMAMFFIELCRASSREDDGTSDVLQECRKINPTSDSNKQLTVEDISSHFKLEEKDAEMLFFKLLEDNSSTTVSYKKFEKYMVKAQKNCIALGHTLLDAKEVVKVLNSVIIGFLTVVVLIAWLLLTNIASTKLLILIASPLLAASFVSGNICKKIFDGVIFSFISHPFDVGDLCVIDNTELEVKHMSVLSTTFTAIGTNEEAFYPNSTLACMPIINRKGEPDLRDLVELKLEPNCTISMLDDLQTKIHKLFDEDGVNKYEKAHSIVVNDIGESVKMEIGFCHVMSIHETTHSQCFRKKRERKSDLLLQIKKMIEETTHHQIYT